MGLAFSMVDGGGVDEDAEDIGLHPCSSTIGIHSSDDSDNESSEFDVFGASVGDHGMFVFGGALRCNEKCNATSKNRCARSLL